MSFKINDRVYVTEGKYKGKTGKVSKLCSVVFAEYVRITFDLKGRERTPQTHMIEEKYVTLENDFLTINNKAMNKPVLKMVLLAAITIGKTNPRKSFDEDAINELAESVKQKGVIQPVLLRPTDKADAYELVCGERRYRASIIAGLKEIPAYIRELSDEEALELQITENLQRKDVHPMDEAFAFKQLLEKYSELPNPVQEVAAKVGKKDYFIKQRMKFNDLTPEWQKLFYKNLFNLTDALKIAMLPTAAQKELLSDCDVTKDNIDKKQSIHISDHKFRSFSGSLKAAPFDLADKTLDKKAGDCNSCKFNSAYSNLFPEDAKNAVCSNISCYKHKCDIGFERELKIALEDPAVIFICSNYYLNDNKIKERLQKEGHEILTTGNYNNIGTQKADIDDFETYKEDMFDEDDDNLEDFKKEYEQYVARETNAQELTEKKIATGKYLKAFIVDGLGKGQYKYVELKKKTATKDSKKAVDTGKASVADIDAEISRIYDREKRSTELDGEKVHVRVIDAIKIGNLLKDVPKAFTDNDRVLMIYILADIGSHSIMDKVKKAIGLSLSYNMPKGDKLYPVLENLTDQQLAYLVRVIAFDRYNTGLPQNNGGYMLRKLAESIGTIPIEAYETEQSEKAAKRLKNVNKRIDELKAQKKELQAAEKKVPVKSAKPSPKKKATA